MAETLASLIREDVEKYSNSILAVDRGIYVRKEHSYAQIYSQAKSLCTYFNQKAIKKGDKIVLYLPNSSDYASLLWACAMSGIIAVPIDFNSSPESVSKISKIVRAKLIFCSVFNSITKNSNLYHQEEMSLLYKNPEIEEKNLPKIKPDDIFEIVYTSGTTSDPKGVVLTNKNILANIISLQQIINFNIKNFAFLSILPLSHLFEQTISFFLPISHGAKIVYIQSRKSTYISKAIIQEKIAAMVSVPLFLESLMHKIEFEAEKLGKLEELNKNLKKFSNYPLLVKKIIFSKIRRKLGNLKYFVVGGSSLDIDVEKFWRNLGYTTLQGYGLTETSPVLTCNGSNENKLGTVGKPLSGIEIKIADGEIIARGDNVFGGYYENEEETRKTLKNGWMHTGDLGSIDKDGFLSITGRKKNIIISSSGLNVYPEDIEKVVNSFPEIKESVVLGIDSGKKLIACIIPKKNLNEKQQFSLRQNINSKLQSHQIISELLVWPEQEFPKTSTLKIKRNLVEEAIISKNFNRIVKQTEKSNDNLINILAEICEISPSKITESSKIVSLGLDSIKRIELAVKIEEVYGLDFNESGINEKSKVKDLRKMIEESEKSRPVSGISFLNLKLFNFLRIPLQYLTILLTTPIFSLEIAGKKNLDMISKEKTPVIFIANHSSMLDTFAIYRAFPFSIRLNTFAAAARDFFFKNFITAALGRLVFNAFAFSRKENVKQSLADFGEIINRKSNILIYPEGTRSRSGNLLEFKAGTGLMAWNTEVPIVPIKLEGLHEVMPVGKHFPELGSRVKVIIGEPITFTKMSSPEEITDKLHEIMKNLK